MLDADLAHVAKLRSEDMAARGTFEHANAAGENPYQIIMRDMPGFRGGVGENIMMETTTRFEPTSVAEIAVDAWLGSPPHAANIASARFDRIGVGIAEKGETAHVTLVFTGPLPNHRGAMRKP